jgi:RNA polymerase sigma-70 factor, ECF subfamily
MTSTLIRGWMHTPSPTNRPHAPAAGADAAWALPWRQPMLRFAQLHLQPREDAEDAVQDALLGVLTLPADRIPSDPRRYLFGILKHKITDRLRQKYRHGPSVDATFTDELDAELFHEGGHWVASVAPTTWHSPESQLQSDQFFQVVDVCIDKLPAKPARVFSMKELLDCEPDEICDTLGLSKADYWQCMSRARKQIQLCLSQNWFDGAAR